MSVKQKGQRANPLNVVVVMCGVAVLRTVLADASRSSCSRTSRNITLHANGTLAIFTSPSYPGPYPVNLNCTYLFTAPEGQRIELSFNNFQLEGSSPKCDKDYIVVRDGPDQSSPVIDRHCGPQEPRTIISSRNFLWMDFVSNQQFFFDGFDGTYRVISEVEIAECTQSKTESKLYSRGYFTTPTFPAKYPRNRKCSWALEAPPAHFMRITFHVFQTQCPNDQLSIRDGDENGQLLGQFCGDETPPEFRGRNLWVSFKSDDELIDKEKGFNISYEVLPLKGLISDHCTDGQNKVLNTSSKGTIQSPWRPDLYPNGMNCVWRIRAPKGKRVKLTFTSFELQSPCDKDSVEVTDVAVNSARGKYCGVGTIPDAFSTGEELTVRFVSDSTERRTGFVAQYEAVDKGQRDEVQTYLLFTLTVLYFILA